MSKDESVKKLRRIILENYHTGKDAKMTSGIIYDAGFRDVEKLRKWVKIKLATLDSKTSTIANTEYLTYQEVLKQLESL
jgi:hypothetical protein